jgi:hypothetical protein
MGHPLESHQLGDQVSVLGLERRGIGKLVAKCAHSDLVMVQFSDLSTEVVGAHMLLSVQAAEDSRREALRDALEGRR